MLPYPHINPTFLKIGPLRFRWYGLMYLLGFGAGYLIIKSEVKRRRIKLKREGDIEDLIFYLALGLILGARLGYVLFYNLSYYLHNPSKIIAVWEGGMSFHGGLIGSIISAVFFLKRRRYDLLLFSDLIILPAPIGIMFGRMGNFINGELYGRVTNVPWAMVFPSGGPLPRHPSQLYEAFFEGVLLFLILFSLRDKKMPNGSLFSIFLTLYGTFRFFLEFFREPDPQLGFIFLGLTMGQILCIPMIIAGISLLFFLFRKTLNN